MTFKRLQEISRPHFFSLTIDKFIPKSIRGFFRYFAAVACIVSFFLSFDILPLSFGSADGFFFLFLFVYIVLFFLEVFYRSISNEGLSLRIADSVTENNIHLDYSLSSILFVTDEIDVSRAIFETKIGDDIFLRSGISKEDCQNFIHSNRVPIIAASMEFDGDNINLSEYVRILYDLDKSLQTFLSQNSINKEEFVGAATWVMNSRNKNRRRDRFWSKENLGALPSIGTSWSYGLSPDLGKFGISFDRSVDISIVDIENGYRDKEVSLLESVLDRRQEANAVIVDDDENVAKDIVGRLVKKIKLGTALPSIEHKEVVELDWNSLLKSFKSKTEIETEILKILNQAVSVGNIILYIKDFSSFMSSTKSSGINLGSLVSPYLASNSIQVITSVNNIDFHFFIETAPTLLEKFERIIPDKAGVVASINVLIEKVEDIEKHHLVRFSYPAVLAIANLADKFVTEGEMPGKALDILYEITSWAVERKISILKEGDVLAFVSENR